MAVFLTQNAPGLRTSPVKRGYWVARRVLGEVIPPPPPVVPELPTDEAKLDLPLRDMLAQHRDNPACAVLSRALRFVRAGVRRLRADWRNADEGSRRTSGRHAGRRSRAAARATGSSGLQAYIRANREKDFLDNLSRKLLVYALGRSPLLSDEPLIQRMNTQLAASGYRVSALIETIVTSPQFLNRSADTDPSADRTVASERMSHARRRISRRTVLRGVGVTMCLPWLESLSAFARRRRRRRSPSGSPCSSWATASTRITGAPKARATAMKLSQSLSPLEPLKKKINVINGLFNKHSTGQGIHPAQTGSLLTGAPLRRGPVIQSGISVDQMIANRIGHETLQPSIVLACEQPMTGYHETNFSMAYSSHISWQNAESPVPNEVYPALAFDTLFENRGSLRNLSILDRVEDDAATPEPPDQLHRPAQAR